MKNIILILSLISFFLTQFIFVNQAKGQSIELIGNNYVNGNPGMPIASYIIVKNITSNSLDVRCQKNIIDTTAGTQNYFCWGTTCWPSTVYVSPDPAGIRTIAAGYSDSTNFTGYYDAFGKQVRAIVEYCFYPLGNISDSTCLTIHFNDSGPSSVNYIKKEIGLNDFYPNPTDGNTSIRYNAEKNSQFHLIDILGNKIKTFDLDYSGTLDISTDEFSSGIYFGNLVVNKRLVAVKKLVIN
tara:strand:- start:28 stop:747 length:720 start_codon:yes stop_codon:yes gene_type:complete